MKNYFLISFLIVLISASGFAWVLLPQYSKLKELYAQNKEITNTLSRSLDLQQLIQEKFTEYGTFSPQKVDLIGSALPEFNSVNVAASLIDLESLFPLSGLPNDTVYILNTDQRLEGNLVSIPIRFDFSDIGYITLKRFVLELQNWNRGIRIISLEVREATNNPESATTVRASLTIELLFVDISDQVSFIEVEGASTDATIDI